MLRNYFKIFVKITRQSKLFTILSVFGISLTIMFIMIISMTLESITRGKGPEADTGNVLYAWRMKSESTVEGRSGQSNSSLSKDLYNNYFKEMKSPEIMSIKSTGQWEFIFNGNRYQEPSMMTDGNFWKIFKFKFIEGRPYSEAEVDEQRNYAVINESLKELLFERGGSALGKTIDYNNQQLTVVGVIKDAPPTALNSAASIYLPYKLLKESYSDPYHGSYTFIFKAPSRRAKAAIIKEAQEIISRVDAADDKLRLFMPGPNTQLEKMLIGYGDPEEYSGKSTPILIFLGKFLAFILLPAINLMALNFSRMRERSEEIGVRKTTGATSSIIRKQFIFENIMLTLAGGFIGIILSYLVVLLFRSQIRIPLDFFRSVEITYSFNPLVFITALASCLLFALLSGVLPAIRMSRMKPVQVLKGGEL